MDFPSSQKATNKYYEDTSWGKRSLIKIGLLVWDSVSIYLSMFIVHLSVDLSYILVRWLLLKHKGRKIAFI